MAKTKNYKNQYLRALADYHNFEKRTMEEKERMIKSASTRMIVKLLPLLNNLEKAEVFVKDEGLNLIKEDFLRVMKEEGLEEIDLSDKKFDPEITEAVEIVDGTDDNKIIEVLRKGYKLNGMVIQPAQVKVSKIK